MNTETLRTDLDLMTDAMMRERGELYRKAEDSTVRLSASVATNLCQVAAMLAQADSVAALGRDGRALGLDDAEDFAQAVNLVQKNRQPFRYALQAMVLHMIGRRLHRMYERACNVGVSDKAHDRAHKRASYEIALLQLPVGVTVDFQTDPRGWPVVVRCGSSECRVGGR